MIELLLKEDKEISAYDIVTTKTVTSELFYVLNKLETDRHTENNDTTVYIYVDHDGYRGSSTFVVNAADDEDSLKQKILDAKATASKINNKYFDLVTPSDIKPEKIVSIETDDLNSIALRCMDMIVEADHFDNVWINSTEIFVTKKMTRFKNSLGVDLEYTKTTLEVELIPTSRNSSGEEFELYLDLVQIDDDFTKVKRAVEDILQNALYRADAIAYDSKTMPYTYASITNDMLVTAISSIKNDLNYMNVLQKSNHYKINDEVVPYDLSIKMLPMIDGVSSSCPFDESGIVLKETDIVKGGKVTSYWGSNRFGQYLNEKPKGSFKTFEVSVENDRRIEDPNGSYMELINFSSPQLDPSSGYFGGEVRLALYHDKDGNITPVTGLSLSGNIYEALVNAYYSKEDKIYRNCKAPKKIYFEDIQLH